MEITDLAFFTDVSDRASEQVYGGADNWGQLTSGAIANGFNQGEHASSFPEPRQGLGNLNKDLASAGYGQKQGLDALTNYISSQLS
jgi:hypothetical protein